MGDSPARTNTSFPSYSVISVSSFKKLMKENDDRLPLLTLDEFFEGNTEEDSIAPNDCDFGRPSIAEIWELFGRQVHKHRFCHILSLSMSILFKY